MVRWIKYIGAASLLTLSLSGCHFGNYESPAPAPTIRYFGAQAASLTVHAAQTKNPTLDEIPTTLQNIFTNPTQITTFDQGSGSSGAGIPGTLPTFPFGQNPPPFIVDPSSGSLSWHYDDGPFYFWYNVDGSVATTCTIEDHTTLAGNISGSESPTVSFLGSSLTLAGDLSFTYAYLIEFRGTNSDGSGCTPVLQSVAGCIQSLASCPGTTSNAQHQNQGIANGLYDYYIDTTVTMTPSDIPTTMSLGYEVTYQ